MPSLESLTPASLTSMGLRRRSWYNPPNQREQKERGQYLFTSREVKQNSLTLTSVVSLNNRS